MELATNIITDPCCGGLIVGVIVGAIVLILANL